MPVFTIAALLLLLTTSLLAQINLLNQPAHLGLPGKPEWSIFEGRNPVGTNLVLNFDLPLPLPATEQTLLIRQDDVKQEWTVTLNGQRLGRLVQAEAPLVHTLPVRPGTLQRANRLEISSRVPDDILINELSLHPLAIEQLFSHSLAIRVLEHGKAGPFPCRITVVDEYGYLAGFHHPGASNIAARPGVIYTPDGAARVGLAAGKYRIYATHGPEFSLAEKEIQVPQTTTVELVLTREVNGSGWVSSDTHIHTLSLSRHGDCLLHERVITLAAEGIEMPVVTEHNLHADYSDAARAMGLSAFFTTVPGNEVTTRKGHFNIFPVSLSAPPPDHTIEDWPALFRNIRSTPNVRVAIINHPTDMHSGFVPFAGTNLNLVTGRNLRGDSDFPFDGMEVINSGAMNSDWMAPFRAWFALLNRGHRITAIASSDSHDVSRFIVGQGRTCIRGNDEVPGAIDVPQVCENLKRGRAVVSLGILPSLEIRERNSPTTAAGPGDLFRAGSAPVELFTRFAAPSWIRPDRSVIYANGRVFKEERFEGKSTGSFSLPIQGIKQDTYYVLMVTAPGVTNQYWSVARPYQPSSPVWDPVMIGATNPVFLDADGDGQFTSPRGYALKLAKLPREQLLAELGNYDWAVATQTAELLHQSGVDLNTFPVRDSRTRQAFDDYLKSLDP